MNTELFNISDKIYDSVFGQVRNSINFQIIDPIDIQIQNQVTNQLLYQIIHVDRNIWHRRESSTK